MSRYLLIALAVLPVLSGCRSRSVPPPETLTLSLDVEEAAPAVAPAANQRRIQVPAPRPSTPAVAPAPAAQTPQTAGEAPRNPSNNRRRNSSLPYTSGQMDSELSPAEQSYVESIRQQHNRQVRENERRVFGGFSL